MSILKSGKASPLQVIVRSLREEGPMFVFKGWTPAFMRLGPNTVLMFVFFEVSLLETHHDS
jgi:dicarboxylate transporter 10